MRLLLGLNELFEGFVLLLLQHLDAVPEFAGVVLSLIALTFTFKQLPIECAFLVILFIRIQLSFSLMLFVFFLTLLLLDWRVLLDLFIVMLILLIIRLTNLASKTLWILPVVVGVLPDPPLWILFNVFNFINKIAQQGI